VHGYHHDGGGSLLHGDGASLRRRDGLAVGALDDDERCHRARDASGCVGRAAAAFSYGRVLGRAIRLTRPFAVLYVHDEPSPGGLMSEKRAGRALAIMVGMLTFGSLPASGAEENPAAARIRAMANLLAKTQRIAVAADCTYDAVQDSGQ